MRRGLPLLLPFLSLLVVAVLTPAHSAQEPANTDTASVPLNSEDSVGLQTSDVPAGELDQTDIGSKTRTPGILLPVYCLLIVAASLFGGWLPSLIRLTHTRMQTVVSFVGGLMLGIGVFHLLPHAAQQQDIDSVAMWMMCGILLMFFLIRTFHFHNHGIAEEPRGDDCDPCGHDHHHSHGHVHSHPQSHELSWMGILVGLSVHTLLDGIALGAAVIGHTGEAVFLPGIGVFLAIVLHKPLDAVSITSLMVAGGWPKAKRQAVNAGFAMMCPLGAALVLLGANRFPGVQQEISGPALAFSAGVFLCIALSDLLPEMEFHSHHRLRLSLALGLGIGVAWTIRFLEPGHIHSI
jgi:zinc and cadmium transporter